MCLSFLFFHFLVFGCFSCRLIHLRSVSRPSFFYILLFFNSEASVKGLFAVPLYIFLSCVLVSLQRNLFKHRQTNSRAPGEFGTYGWSDVGGRGRQPGWEGEGRGEGGRKGGHGRFGSQGRARSGRGRPARSVCALHEGHVWAGIACSARTQIS